MLVGAQSNSAGVWNQLLQVASAFVTFVKETIVQTIFAKVTAPTLMILSEVEIVWEAGKELPSRFGDQQ